MGGAQDELRSAAGVALDGEGRIAVDAACVRCAYNLRGMLPDGHCPECGIAVRRVVELYEPRTIAWLQSVGGSAHALFVVTTLACCLGVIQSAAKGGDWMGELLVFIYLALVGACVLGMTARDPRASVPWRRLAARRVARWALALAGFFAAALVGCRSLDLQAGATMALHGLGLAAGMCALAVLKHLREVLSSTMKPRRRWTLTAAPWLVLTTMVLGAVLTWGDSVICHFSRTMLRAPLLASELEAVAAGCGVLAVVAGLAALAQAGWAIGDAVRERTPVE